MTVLSPLPDLFVRKPVLPTSRRYRAHPRHPPVTRDELALILAHDLQYKGMRVFSRRLYRVLKDVYGQGADAMLAQIAAFIPDDENAPDRKAGSGQARPA